MRQLETTWYFFCFVFCAAAMFHLLQLCRVRSSMPARFHVRISGGGIVYQDYYTTNPPPVWHPEKPWFERLTNYETTK